MPAVNDISLRRVLRTLRQRHNAGDGRGTLQLLATLPVGEWLSEQIVASATFGELDARTRIRAQAAYHQRRSIPIADAISWLRASLQPTPIRRRRRGLSASRKQVDTIFRLAF